MVDVSFPSDDLPGPVAYQVTLPDGWTAMVAPEVDVVLTAPVVEGHFRPNVVVTQARVSGEFTLDQASEVARAQLLQLPELVIGDDRTIELDGRPAAVRQYAFRSDSVGIGLLQVQLQTLVVTGEHLSSLITMTASCSGAEATELAPVLQSVVMSWRVTAK